MNREIIANRIKTALTSWQNYVNISNSNNEMSSNIYSEDIICELLNVIYDFSLINLNITKSNTPGIDLFEESSKIGFQITSDRTPGKILKTLRKTHSNLELDVKELYVFILGKKSKIEQIKIDNLGLGYLNFVVEKNIIDIYDLYKKIITLETEKLDKIDKILTYNIGSESLPINNSKKNVVFSFDERDIDFVTKIAKVLIENDYVIYSGSTLLEDNLKGMNKNSHNVIKSSSIPNNTVLCLMFLSKNYYESRLKELGKVCSLTEHCSRKKYKIVPIRFTGNVPKVRLFELEKNPSIFCDVDQIEKIINLIKHYSNINNENFKGYDAEKVLRSKDSNFVSIAQVLDKKLKIGYQIFSKHEEAIKKNRIESICLCLFKGITFEKTIDHIFENNPNLNRIVSEERIFIILPKERDIDYDFRKKYISRLSKVDVAQIYFSDEFIWKFCTPKHIKEERLFQNDPGGFVQPMLSIYNKRQGEAILPSQKKPSLESDIVIEDFFNNDEVQILFLVGSGGIGKTTLVKQISDNFKSTKKEASVIFLDATKIIQNLSSYYEDVAQLEIYDLYRSQFGLYLKDTENILNRELFDCNLDNGNILLVIDGVDEIIGKLNNFDLQNFIESINNTDISLGYAKIVITSRIGDWVNKFSEDNQGVFAISIFEVLPFNKDLARAFFSKRRFDSKKTERILLELQGMVEHTDVEKNPLFPPFILDVVSKFDQSISYSRNYNTQLLNVEENKTDRILASICSREIARQQQVDIDKQLLVLMEIAIKHKGIINTAQLKLVLENKRIPTNKFPLFLVHPLLEERNSIVKFSYDFFLDYFKSIYIFNEIFVDTSNEISEHTVDLLIEDFHSNTNVSKETTKRLNRPLVFTKIKDKIDCILFWMLEKNKSEIEMSKAITGLFTTILSSQGGSIEKNTLLLKSIFTSDDNNVFNFRYYNPNGEYIFNFSSLKFRSAKIEGYNDFFDCIFDNDTYFDDLCELKQVYSNREKEISAKEINFSPRLSSDHTLYDIFKIKSKNLEHKNALARDVLKDFFSIFEERAYFVRREYVTSISRFNRKKSVKTIEFDDLEDILVDNKILEIIYDGHKFLRISNSFKSDVEKFCQENMVSIQLDLSIKLIVDDLL